MRRADRLFQIIQILRRHSRPVKASLLAADLEVSKRSVYRYIADRMGQRAPIRGEGYILDRDFDMPPLKLTPDEIEAAVLGAQWVAERGDPALAGAARDLIAKIASAIPDHLRPFIAESTIGAPRGNVRTRDGLDIATTRAWIRSGRKIRIRYRDQETQESERIIWPAIRLRRDSAIAGGLVRAASGVSPFQDGPRRRGRISRQTSWLSARRVEKPMKKPDGDGAPNSLGRARRRLTFCKLGLDVAQGQLYAKFSA